MNAYELMEVFLLALILLACVRYMYLRLSALIGSEKQSGCAGCAGACGKMDLSCPEQKKRERWPAVGARR